MVALLDEAIADLRAAAGLQWFDLSFVASTHPAPLFEWTTTSRRLRAPATTGAARAFLRTNSSGRFDRRIEGRH
jgi:hypothetical protein